MQQKVTNDKYLFIFVLMTLQEAFEQLTNSPEFKEIAKGKDALGSKYRIYLSRFKAGKLKSGAITELLLSHGYQITANKAIKGKKLIKSVIE